MTNQPNHHGAIGATRKVSIKVFGVGSAGVKSVEHMINSGFPGVTFAVLDGDEELLARSSATEIFPLDGKALRRLGAGSEAERVRTALGELSARLKSACERVDVVFIVAGLGGKTGTTVSPVLAQVAKEAGALALAFVTLPFDYEAARQRQAARGLEHLKAAADGVICLPNQKIFKLIDAKTSLMDTFKASDKLLADGVRGIWRLLTYTALIEIHLADLCALVRDRHEESALAVAEATGPDRAREVMEKLLAHPMLDGGQMLAVSDTVLVSLMGGPDLTAGEVSQVMEQINRRCENAHVIMGAAVDAEFKDRLAVILIAARGEASGTEGAMPAHAARGSAPAPSSTAKSEPGDHFLTSTLTSRPASRFAPPPPALTPEKMEQLLARQSGISGRQRKNAAKLLQGQLPLEIVSKGRFDKSEPTIYKGEDLDVPTYIRRGLVLN